MIRAEPSPSCRCGCRDADGSRVHGIVEALAVDDFDRAIELGLLEDIACTGCGTSCREQLRAARETRKNALAARERHRAREARLQRLRQERDQQRRAAPSPVAGATSEPTPVRPALPSAAAAALARARAKAAERHKP